MKRPTETALAQRLPASVPFVGPEALERETGTRFRARLGANESVFGPSPRVIEALRAAADDVWMYGDPESYELRHALGAHLGISPDEVVVGEGIDGLLGYLVRLYVAPGDTVVTSDGAYPTFNYHVAGYGGHLVTVPYVDDREDPESLLKAARENNARLIYLANPDNPMGTWHDAATIEALIDALPENCVLALDEAYVEFAPDGSVPAISTQDPRVVRFRTFSKAHGLAGMRVGYAFGAADVIRGFEKIRNHFGMSRAGQVAALAALEDVAWVREVRARVEEARARIGNIVAENGLESLPSATNFVTVDCGRDAPYAKSVLAGLVDRGVFVRMPFAAPGNRCIRISAGRPEDLDLLAEVLPEVLTG